MNNSLAFISSLQRCSVSAKIGSQIVTIDKPVDSSKYLVQIIQEICLSCNKNIFDFQNIITCRGPGSFTGIRTCLSVARGIRASTALMNQSELPKILSVTSFDIVCADLNDEDKDSKVLAIKSEKDDFYCRFSSNSKSVSYCTLTRNKINDLQNCIINCDDIYDSKKILNVSIESMTENLSPIYLSAACDGANY